MPGSTLTNHAGPKTAVHYLGYLAPGLPPLNARRVSHSFKLSFFFYGDVNIGGGQAHVGAGGIWQISVSSLQRYCDPKTTLGKRNKFTQRGGLWGEQLLGEEITSVVAFTPRAQNRIGFGEQSLLPS